MRVVFVTGATATGKSKWAYELALKTGAVIINCDSVQVYSGLTVGTAMPPIAERQSLPHYLFDFVKFPETLTAGDYRRHFFRTLESLPADSKVLVVGGTGFYLQAIEKGMHDSPSVPEDLSQSVFQESKEPQGLVKLYEELLEKDIRRAQKLSPNDAYRICRSIEIIRAFGKTHTEILESFTPDPFPYPLLKTGVLLEKEEHRSRIQRRIQQMLASGLRQEVEEALARGWRAWGPMESVGYKEMVQAIDEGYDDRWVQEKVEISTWQLAKRQKTWFQRDKEIHIFDGTSEQEKFEVQVRAFLNS